MRYVVNLNWKLWTIEKQQHCFGITRNVMCVPIHAFALHSNTNFFLQQSFAWNLKNISPIVWYCCNIWSPYKISFIQNKGESSLVFIDNIRQVTWPFLNDFILLAAWRVFVQKHWKVCCSLLQWSDIHTWESDVEHALCTFSGGYWEYFQVFHWFGCAKWKYCEKWHLPALKIWNPFFFILSRVQREEFYYEKTVSCKSYVQLLIQVSK